MADLAGSATQLLQELLRFNTVNPPGNERPAQEHLAARLRDAGFEVELIGRTPERPNLVARLRGTGDGPTLCLLSHVDTVYATAGDWEHDPWSGDIADGCIWGRGALDMKSQTAAEVAAALDLARSGWRPAAGDLLVVVLVDEETGGSEGAQWICQTHPDKVRCDYLLNEGAGPVLPFDGGRYLGVCVAEKGVFRFRVHVDGVAGHASLPKIGDNALLKLAPLLERMGTHSAGFDLTEGPRAMLEGLGFDASDPGAALESLRAKDPALAVLVEPMLGVTVAPTRAWASEKINVIPALATIGVDCRVPPGLGRDVAEARVTEVLGRAGRGPSLPPRMDRAGRGQRVTRGVGADGRDPRLGRRARPRRGDHPDDPARVHRLALVPRRLPRRRRLRLLPAQAHDAAGDRAAGALGQRAHRPSATSRTRPRSSAT